MAASAVVVALPRLLQLTLERADPPRVGSVRAWIENRVDIAEMGKRRRCAADALQMRGVEFLALTTARGCRPAPQLSSAISPHARRVARRSAAAIFLTAG